MYWHLLTKLRKHITLCTLRNTETDYKLEVQYCIKTTTEKCRFTKCRLSLQKEANCKTVVWKSVKRLATKWLWAWFQLWVVEGHGRRARGGGGVREGEGRGWGASQINNSAMPARSAKKLKTKKNGRIAQQRRFIVRLHLQNFSPRPTFCMPLKIPLCGCHYIKLT